MVDGIRQDGTFNYNEVSKEFTDQITTDHTQYLTDMEQDTELQQKNHMIGDYTMPHYDPAALQDTRNKHERKHGLKSIRDAIRSVFSHRSQDQFKKYDELVTSTEEEKVELHHSLGTKLMANGELVMELDIAGSGFKHFRSQQKGFKGKDIPSDSENFKKTIGERIFGKDKGIFMKKKKVKDQDGQTKEMKRFNMSGPGGLDFGDFNTDEIKNHIIVLGSNYFINTFNDERWKANPVNVNLNIQGHSRGAVATAEAVKFLLEFVQEKFPQYKDYVKINMIQHDPVPGGDNLTGEKVAIDMRGVKDMTNSTTVCSLYTEHTVLQFTPQEVRGQQRIILCNEHHSVGMDEGDASQKDVNGKQVVHRKALFDSKTGEAYRGSGVAELDKAVFMEDEHGVLVRMRSYAQAMQVINYSLKGKINEHGRKSVIEHMVKNWFIDNEYVDETETDEEFAEETIRVDAIIDELFDMDEKDSTLMEVLKSSIMGVKNGRSRFIDNGEYPSAHAKEMMMTMYEGAIRHCKEYMEQKNPYTPTGQKRLEMVSDILSQYRAEKKRMEKLPIRGAAGPAAGPAPATN